MTQARSRVSCGKCSALHRGTLCVLVVPAVVAAHRMCCLSLVALRGRAGSGLCPASRRDATRLQLGFPRGTHSRGHRCSDCVGHHPWARHRSSRPRIGGIGPRRRAAVTAGFGIGTCEQFVGQWACSLSPSGTQPPYMMSPLLLRTGNTRLKLQTFHPGHARNVHRRASIVDGRRAMEPPPQPRLGPAACLTPPRSQTAAVLLSAGTARSSWRSTMRSLSRCGARNPQLPPPAAPCRTVCRALIASCVVSGLQDGFLPADVPAGAVQSKQLP